MSSKHWDFPRSIVSAQNLLVLGERHGNRREDLLAGTQIEVAQLGNPDVLMDADDELHIIRNLQRLNPDEPALGLQAGALYQLSCYGIWGFAQACSPTARKAMELSLSYPELTFAFSAVQVEEAGDEASWIFDDSAVPIDVRLFSIEREIAAFATIAGELVGPKLSYRRIELRHAPPRWASLYQEIFRAPVTFNADRNACVADRSLLDEPLKMGNEMTARMLENQCRELVSRRGARRGLAGQVRDVLLRERRHVPDMEDVAKALCMSARTLRRKLDAEGTSFRQLSDEIRTVVAEEMLSRTRLSTEQIAERLSYADASSFSQAFRRMTGVSPGTYRMQAIR